MCLRRKKEGKSKVLSGKFYIRDLEAEQRALPFSHVYCSNVNSYSSPSESNRQNPPDRTMDLSFFSRCKDITSLENLFSLEPSESLHYWFQSIFAAMFVLNYCSREFLLSAFPNRFEFRCEPKLCITKFILVAF